MKKVRCIVIGVYVLGMTCLQVRMFFDITTTSQRMFGSVFLEAFSVLTMYVLIESIFKLIKYCLIYKKGIQAKGIIKKYYTDTARYNTYYPYVEFKDNNKLSHIFKSNVGMAHISSKYKKGKKLKVIYLPDSPKDSIIVPAYFYGGIIEILMMAVLCVPSFVCSLVLALGL